MTIIKFFLHNTHQKMAPIFGKEKTDVLIDRLNNEIVHLFEVNENILPDDLAKRHAVNPLFIIALKNTLNSEIKEISEFERFVHDIIMIIYQDKMKSQKELFAKGKSRWEEFIKDKQKLNDKIFKNQYFKLEYIHEDRFRFGFNLNQCFYSEIFEKNGEAKLLPILCKFEEIFADNLQQWVKFSMQTSIPNGADKCRFRYINIDPQ